MKLVHRAPVHAVKPQQRCQPFSAAQSQRHSGRRCVRAWAEEENDEAFEKRLAKLKRGGDEGEAKKQDNKQKAAAPSAGATKAKTPMQVDYSDETVWREFKPAQSDLYFNIALGFTLVWLPLTASAVGRCLFVNYKVTDKRVCVSTSSPWSKEESQVGMHEVANVTGVNRAFGLYGDMVISLTSGDKLELRSIPKWQEVRDYIVERRNAVRGSDISTAELMGESS